MNTCLNIRVKYIRPINKYRGPIRWNTHRLFVPFCAKGFFFFSFQTHLASLLPPKQPTTTEFLPFRGYWKNHISRAREPKGKVFSFISAALPLFQLLFLISWKIKSWVLLSDQLIGLGFLESLIVSTLSPSPPIVLGRAKSRIIDLFLVFKIYTKQNPRE